MNPPASSPDDNSAPNFQKVGFGAMGNVSVNHDASQHHQANDHSVNYQRVTNIQQAPNEQGQWNLLLGVVVVLGLIGVILALGLLNNQPPAPALPVPQQPSTTVIVQPMPVVLPPTEKPAPPITQAETAGAKLPSAPVVVTDPPAPPAAAPASPLSLTSNKSRYTAGEVVELTLTTQREGYVRLLYRDANGQTTLVLPNAAHDGHLLSGQPLHWTSDSLRRPLSGTNKDQILRLRVSGPPFGHEEFVAVFSEKDYSDTKSLLADLSQSRTGMATSHPSKAVTLEVEEVQRTAPENVVSSEVRLPIETFP